MQRIFHFLLLLGVLYALACVALFAFQRSLIYFPPQGAAVPAPKTSTLEVTGARVRVSERPLQGTRALIYFGGNAEDVTMSLPQLDSVFPDRALYLMHYRGYAGSTGKPTEKALVADALALFDRVHAQHGDVVVIGRSLGSGIAVQVAAARPLSRLVLVTPYDSLQGLAADRFSWFPVRSLLQDKYESWRHAPRVTAPTLLLAADHDEIIPAASTRRLLTRFAPGVASMTVIEGSGHNTISDASAYVESLKWAK
ncbi:MULTISPECIES: alpha/beta hydrolase [unclassified Massilia]|uniref:alpha/beta hydrolase n=1 Tax=unclassified Massilia TaxID=2609279 RepID=UPI00191CCD36|nr:MULTISPECIES: hypothetical protein [unclassified Massilia]